MPDSPLADDHIPQAWTGRADDWRKHVAECADCNIRYGDKSLGVVTVRRADLIDYMQRHGGVNLGNEADVRLAAELQGDF